MEYIQQNKGLHHSFRDGWKYVFISIFIGLIPGTLIFICSYYPRNDFSSVIFSLGIAFIFSLASFLISLGALLIIFNPGNLFKRSVDSTKLQDPSAWDYWQSQGLTNPDPTSMDARITTPQPLSLDLYYDYFKIKKHDDLDDI